VDDDQIPLPLLATENRAFWTGGADGRLLIDRCGNCRRWLHPPVPICNRCGSRDIDPEPTSGRAEVVTFTVNRHRWTPQTTVPFLLAMVELPEQEGLRLTTHLIDCDVDDVEIGMAVEVTFHHRDDVWLPFFRPVAA
jgi:uncharacterized protein